MQKSPLDVLKQFDEELIDQVMGNMNMAFTEGALSVKTKKLIALGIDASIGAEEGVRNLAKQALEAGATKEEIMETIRIVNFIRGASGVFTAARALDGVLKD